ncbi:hypothetical protein PLICRDRAFT_173377 [Plicaturopsis crispa FD-325 SS-3]|nr:hypothetical protein PLICRDRAFT_173377 [Plicaturopsis crispa FD-325 SS-3]
MALLVAKRTSSCLRSGPRRPFSSAAVQRDHYKTLSVPHHASKSQIKSSYYQLSKKYHPDLNKNPEESAIYPSLRHAYDVLIDDRRRRAYDRSLQHNTTHASSTTEEHRGHPHWSTHRHRGATHAWQRSSRHGPTYHGPGSSPFSRPSHEHPYQSADARSYREDPFTYGFPGGSHEDAKEAGKRRPGYQKKGQDEQEAMDRVKNISPFWRNLAIVGTGVLVLSFSKRGNA